jgi:hypothetical protein
VSSAALPGIVIATPKTENPLPHNPTAPGVAAPPQTSARPDPEHQLPAQEPEDLHWEQLLAGMPAWPDPPPEEPPGNTMLDPEQIPADDPLWDDFYALPFQLPTDPQQGAFLSSL